jgi:hypothetical protein
MGERHLSPEAMRPPLTVPLDLSSFTQDELGLLYIQADRIRLLGLSKVHERFGAVMRAAIADAIEKCNRAAVG